MKKISNKIILIVLAGIISVIDLFFSGNGFIQFLLALSCTFLAFNLPSLSFRIKKIPYILLIAANIILLVFTFPHRVLLINMLFLSYLIWRITTPRLVRFRSLLSVTVLLAIISVYSAAYLDFSLPLFIVVFYPLYVLGSVVNNSNIIRTRKIWIFSLSNIILSGLLLLASLYISLGHSIIGSVLFLNTQKPGTTSAVYLPFIALFLIWFGASSNFFLTMVFSKFEKSSAAFDLTSYFKPVFNLFSFLAVVTISTFICEFSIRQDIKTTLIDITQPNIMFNIILLCSLYICLISILGKGISNVIIALLTIFLGVANYIKFTYFSEPFYPWDVYLIKNLIGICKEYLNIPVIIAVSIVVLAGIFLIIFFRKNVARYLKPKITVMLLPFGVIMLLLNVNVLEHNSLSTQIGIQRSWYIGELEMRTNGLFTQNFFYLEELDKYMNPKPDGYSEDTMLSIDNKYGSSTPAFSNSTDSKDVKPNIVMVMSESWWDLTKLNGIEFSKDIAENVHKYQKGELAPPALGGGTANTEFEALTGMSLYFMSPGVIAYNAYLRTETPSIASILKSNGYSTTAIHPNSGWFYNRDKVYDYFGFDKFLDVDSFYANDTKGPYVSDYALTDKILETLDQSSGPAFVFAVSMENHDPFNDKFPSFDLDVESDQLSQQEKEIVQGYAQGLYDADQSLGKLIDALSKSDRPTLVYFFGDHAPRLGTLDDYYRVYDRLGTKEAPAEAKGFDNLKYYTTPYVSWSNYKEMRTFDKIVSPSHIGYEVLKDAGVKFPNYFNILPQLEATYPIMHLQGMGMIDTESDLVKDYQLIQYDLLFGKKYLQGTIN